MGALRHGQRLVGLDRPDGVECLRPRLGRLAFALPPSLLERYLPVSERDRLDGSADEVPQAGEGGIFDEAFAVGGRNQAGRPAVGVPAAAHLHDAYKLLVLGEAQHPVQRRVALHLRIHGVVLRHDL